MEKICPLMSRADPHDDTKIVWIECQKEKCELWSSVWTTENLQGYGCSFRMNVGVNSEGKYVV